MIYVYPVRHKFLVGNTVVDKTAIANNWPDKEGEVIEVDGSNIKVKYDSGNERWKMFGLYLGRCMQTIKVAYG